MKYNRRVFKLPRQSGVYISNHVCPTEPMGIPTPGWPAACNNDASIGWFDCRKILNVVHCLNIFVPYHHVADVRNYRGYGRGSTLIVAGISTPWRGLRSVEIALDRNLAHRIHPVLPQTLPQFLQFLHIHITRTNLRGIKVTRTQSLVGIFIPWSWYDISGMVMAIHVLPLTRRRKFNNDIKMERSWCFFLINWNC
jgi:hypothetical protein